MKTPMTIINRLICGGVLFLLFSCGGNQTVSTLQVPGMDRYCEINPAGESVIPSGRLRETLRRFYTHPP